MTPTTTRSRLPYWPALDGLRALAVVAVLLYHQDFTWARGGFLGVSLFFTLSGFLITSLLVAEWDATGTIRLRAFWGRRLRRLAPAGLIALGLALVVIHVSLPSAQVAEATGDVRAALAYVANWRFIVVGVPYADLFRVPSPVQHFWSLAIEEQFYLVFPLLSLVALRKGKRALGAALIVVTGVSLVLQLHYGATDRTYYGTDTRAAELALGGLLALGYPRLKALVLDRARVLVDIAGFVALFAMVVLWSRLQLSTQSLYRGGFVAVGCLSVVLLVGALESAPLRALLSARPLVWIGRISYGVYVFHFPLYMLLSEDRMGFGGVELFAVRVAATVGLAAVSSWLVERPVRERRTLVRPTRALPAFLGTAAVVAAFTIPSAAAPLPVGRLATAKAPSPTRPPATFPTTQPSVVASSDPTTAQPTTTTTADPVPRRAPRVVVLGDSTALSNGVGMSQWGDKTGGLQVDEVNSLSCPVLTGDVELIRQGFEATLTPECANLMDTAVSEAYRVDADAFVVFIGSAQLSDWKYHGESQYRSVEDPDVDSWYTAALTASLNKLTTAKIPILWADVPVPNWSLERSAQVFGGVYPGTGPPTMNSAPRTAILNQLDTTVLAQYPQAVQLSWAALLAGPVDPRPDGLHLDVPTVMQLMDGPMRDLLVSGYQTVVANPASGIGAREITWAP